MFTRVCLKAHHLLCCLRHSDTHRIAHTPRVFISRRLVSGDFKTNSPILPAYAFVLAMLIAVNALPTVVRSQVTEEPSPATTTESAVTTPESTSSLIGLYPIEGIPGGGAVVGDFVVGPGKVDVTIAPGDSMTVDMTVTNRTGERHRFNITTEDARGSQDTTKTIELLGDDRGPYSMKDYVSVPYKTFELDHNQRARIPVTITVPPNAEPGGLYGSVLIDTVAVDAVAGDTAGAAPQSAIVARIGTLFFITIPGAVEKDGELKGISAIPEQMFYQGGPINFGITFENRGSIHLAPYGEMRIKNMFNEEVGYVQLDPWFVLPKSLRLREVSWDRDFLFGRYTATAYINRSYDDIVDEKTFVFWVLPWKPLAGIFAVLFFVIFLFRTFFRKFEFKRK